MNAVGARIPRRIYVERGGTYWSFEPEEWLDVLARTEGGPLVLPEAEALSRRPRTVQTARGANAERALSTDPEIWVIQPSGWTLRQRTWHQAALQRLLSP